VARFQTVVTTMTCDMHEDDTEATETFVVALDAGTRLRSLPRVVDVCEDHAAQLRELETAVRRKGVTVNATATVAATVPCAVCGKDVTRSNAVAHLVSAHNVPRIPQPAQCPDCGKAVDNPNGMTLHRKANHGYDILAEYAAAAAKPRRRKGR
jgi:endogenous inhibitor of DNA gyrase (YacG/DUF329 family)